MDKKLLSAIRYTLSVIIAAALLWMAFRGMDWGEFLNGLKSTSWGYIVLSMVAGGIALIFRALRWKMQLKALDPGIRISSIWHGSNIGNFVSMAIPGVGEFVRCAEVSTEKARYEKTLGSIIVERVWDILAIGILIVVAFTGSSNSLRPFLEEYILQPLASRFSASLWLILAIALIAVAVILWLIWRFRSSSRFCRKCADAAKGMVRGMAAFGKMENKGLFLAYTVGIWLMYIVMTWLTFLAIPELSSLCFRDAVFISAVGNLASVVPTPGNLGPYHYLVGLSISSIYLGSSAITATALLCATLSHGSHALLIIILGAVSYFRKMFV